MKLNENYVLHYNAFMHNKRDFIDINIANKYDLQIYLYVYTKP